MAAYTSAVISNDETNQDNDRQLRTLRFLLQATHRGDRVLDGTGFHLFRQGAYPQWALPPPVGYAIRTGHLSPSIQQVLERTPVAAIVADPWLRFAAGPEGMGWIRDHYVSIGGWVMVPGVHLFPTAAGRRTRFEVEVPGEYELAAASGNAVAPSVDLEVDGRKIPMARRVWLERGPHEARVSGTFQELWLRLPTPAEADREIRQLATVYDNRDLEAANFGLTKTVRAEKAWPSDLETP
jgi:hypothetical protein